MSGYGLLFRRHSRHSNDRYCEHCEETMHRDTTVCPHCGQSSQPWVLHDEIWWSKREDGWYWLNDQEDEWFLYDPGQDVVPPPSS